MTPAERIAELEDEVAWLKSELGLVESRALTERLRLAFGVTPAQAACLTALYVTPRAMSYDQLMDRVPVSWRTEDASDWNHAKVLICRLRKTLGKQSIVTLRAFGFELSDEGRNLCDSRLYPTRVAA